MVGVPLNYTLPTAHTVATNVTCPIFSKYHSGCTFTTGNTCQDKGGYVLLSCLSTSKYTVHFVSIKSLVPHVCVHGDVRITNGATNYTGRVEFCYFGTWRTICGNQFSQTDAAVACRLAGFSKHCKFI